MYYDATADKNIQYIKRSQFFDYKFDNRYNYYYNYNFIYAREYRKFLFYKVYYSYTKSSIREWLPKEFYEKIKTSFNRVLAKEERQLRIWKSELELRNKLSRKININILAKDYYLLNKLKNQWEEYTRLKIEDRPWRQVLKEWELSTKNIILSNKSADRNIIDPVYNLNQASLNLTREIGKDFFFTSNKKGRIQNHNIFRYDHFRDLTLYYYYYYKTKYYYRLNKLLRLNNTLIWDQNTYFHNFLFRKEYSIFGRHINKMFKKKYKWMVSQGELHNTSKNTTYQDFWSFQKSTFDVLWTSLKKHQDFKINKKFLLSYTKNYFIKSFFYFFNKTHTRLLHSNSIMNTSFSVRWQKKKLKHGNSWFWNKVRSFKKSKSRGVWFNVIDYFDQMRKRKGLGFIKKKKEFIGTNKRIRLKPFKQEYLSDIKKNSHSLTTLLSHISYSKRVLRPYYFFLDQYKPFFDYFYICERFNKWVFKKNTTNITGKTYYNLVKKNIKNRKKYIQTKSMFTTYNKWYNYLFSKNYKNILMVLNCYFNNKNKKNKSNYNDHYNFNTSIKNFLSRQQKLYKWNFFYRLYLDKKALKYYKYYFNNKLLNIKQFNFSIQDNFSKTSYIHDVSLFFKDSIINWKFVKQLDEKFYFFLKHLLFKQFHSKNELLFNNNLHKKKTSNVIFRHSLRIHEQYRILFYNMMSCVGNILININTKSESIYFSYLMHKYFFFIKKSKIFLFFRDWFIINFKNYFYTFKFNSKIIYQRYLLSKKRSIKKQYIPDLKLFTKKILRQLVRPSDKLSEDLFSIISELKKLNTFTTLDWFFYIKRVLKTKLTSISTKLTYSLLSLKKVRLLKQKLFLKKIRSYVSKNICKFDFSILYNFFKYKNEAFKVYRGVQENKMKSFYLNIYKIYIFYFFKKKLKGLEFNFLNNYWPWKKKYVSSNSNSKTKTKTKTNTNTNNNSSSKYIWFEYFYNKCKNLITSKSKWFRKKYHSRFFEIFKNLDFFFTSKKKKKYNNTSMYLWNNLLSNKQLILHSSLNIVKMLYSIEKNNSFSIDVVKTLYKLSSIIKYSNTREFYLIEFLKNYNSSKKKNSTSLVQKEFKSYVPFRKRRDFFLLTNYSTVSMVFFLFLRQTILEGTINNSVIYYKNTWFIYNMKTTNIFFKEYFLQFDYHIKTFLDQELDILFKSS